MPHESTVEHDGSDMSESEDLLYAVAMRSRKSVDEESMNGKVTSDGLNQSRHPVNGESVVPHRRAQTPQAVTHHHDADDSGDEGSPVTSD